MTSRPGELPKGWAWSTIGEILVGSVFTDGDWVESKDQDHDGPVRLVQLADVGEGEFRDRSDRWLNELTAERLNCTYLRKGDVLFARMPDPIGRACLVPDLKYAAVTVVDVCVIRPDGEAILPAWLMWAVNSPEFRDCVVALESGTTRKRISRKNLATVAIPVPPRAEQERIVAAVEEHLSRLGSAEAAMARAATRSATLHTHVAREAASGWPTVRLGEVSEVFVGSTPARSDQTLWNGSVPWVSSGEVSFCRIRTTRESISSRAVRPDRIHPPGTVLLGMIGEGKTRGQAAILEVSASHNQNSAAIRPDRSQLSPEWLFHHFRASYEANRRVGSGNNQPALNKKRVAELEVPLPPLAEQERLTARLDAAEADGRRLRSEVDRAAAHAAALRRSILGAAFSGRLVAQDPADEPAEVLLARIAGSGPQPAPRAGPRRSR